jgi:hypothetical protein
MLAVGANLVVFAMVDRLWLQTRPGTDGVAMVVGDTGHALATSGSSARGVGIFSETRAVGAVEAFLAGIDRGDALTYAGTAVLVLGVTALAGATAAVRLRRIRPSEALRAD